MGVEGFAVGAKVGKRCYDCEGQSAVLVKGGSGDGQTKRPGRGRRAKNGKWTHGSRLRYDLMQLCNTGG